MSSLVPDTDPSIVSPVRIPEPAPRRDDSRASWLEEVNAAVDRAFNEFVEDELVPVRPLEKPFLDDRKDW